MMTLRCTKKLLSRLPPQPRPVVAKPTNVLGDWYANLLFTRPERLVICVSERSLLSVLVPGRDLDRLVPRFHGAALNLLRWIGVPESQIAAEAREMTQVAIGPTANRQVLGSMNDLIDQFRWIVEKRGEFDPHAVAIDLTGVLCGPLQYRSPREVALEIFRSG